MNLHCGLGDWEARMDDVVNEILKHNPDVIGLQEVCYNKDMNMTADILQKLNQGGYEVKFSRTTDTHKSFLKYQEELLVITRHEVSATIDEDLPSLKFFENRLLAIEIDGTWFVNTHLHFALPQIRTQQYKKISKLFSDKSALLMGDLNSNSGNGESKILKTNNWKDYFNGPTYPSHKPSKTFDGFWTSSLFTKNILKFDMTRLFVDAVNPPSDHLGVMLELELKK